MAIKYGAEKAADENQIRQLKQMNESYKSELENMYELIDQRRGEAEQLQNQVWKMKAILFGILCIFEEFLSRKREERETDLNIHI